MASTSQLPPAATRQHNFEQAVAYSLHLWPALTLSVANGWGGPESSEKRDWFAGAIVDLFPEFTDAPPAASNTASNAGAAPSTTAPADETDTEDVETVLLQVMVDEFEVNVDDDSALEVAQQIIRARAQCAVGQYDETKALAERFANLKGSKVGQMFQKADDPNQDTDEEASDSDEDGGSDVDMGEASAPAAPKEKPEPEVDEDGFTMVTKKKR